MQIVAYLTSFENGVSIVAAFVVTVVSGTINVVLVVLVLLLLLLLLCKL
jgi:hypothetical protein